MTQTVDELKARLIKVRSAIDGGLGNRRYRIGSGSSQRELERHSLKELLELESSLLAQIARLEGTSIRHGVPCP